jgi:hypothetical protein
MLTGRYILEKEALAKIKDAKGRCYSQSKAKQILHPSPMNQDRQLKAK